jgi:hypothetical protein
MTSDASAIAVPDDFPDEDAPGCVSGAQPKMLLRQVEGSFGTRMPAAQRRAEWTRAEDMAQQMKAYCLRKLAEGAVRDEQGALLRGLGGLRAKPWFSDPQNLWIMRRVADLLGWTRLNVQANRTTSIDLTLEQAIERGIVLVGPPNPRPRPVPRAEQLMNEARERERGSL